MTSAPSGTIRIRPRKGYSVHLGGPWYVQSLPDSGRIIYAKDHGTGTHEVARELVPVDVRLRAEGTPR